MATVFITLNTTQVDTNDFETFVRDGEVISASGVINLRWEDFTAIDIAERLGFQEVNWDALGDDTPGSLSVTVCYPYLSSLAIEARCQSKSYIEDYSVRNPLILRHYI